MLRYTLMQPPEIIGLSNPVIFLGGPIKGAADWQTEATSRIHQLDPTIAVASPRRDSLEDASFVYEDQVDWETHYLRRAGNLGVAAFWLARQSFETPGRPYAQTTRFELGEWKMMHQTYGTQLTIGIEQGFSNERYIRRRFGQDCPEVQIVDNLDAMCVNAVTLVGSARQLALF